VTHIICNSEDRYDRCPSIGSVRDGSSKKDALRKLGAAVEKSIAKDIFLSFPHLGVRLALTPEEKVWHFQVYDPTAP